MATYGQFDTLGPFTAAIGVGGSCTITSLGPPPPRTCGVTAINRTPSHNPLWRIQWGGVVFYADGLYDFVVYDSNDVLKYTWDGCFTGASKVPTTVKGLH